MDLPKTQTAFLFTLLVIVGGSSVYMWEEVYQIKIDQARDEVNIEYISSDIKEIKQDIKELKTLIRDTNE